MDGVLYKLGCSPSIRNTSRMGLPGRPNPCMAHTAKGRIRDVGSQWRGVSGTIVPRYGPSQCPPAALPARNNLAKRRRPRATARLLACSGLAIPDGPHFAPFPFRFGPRSPCLALSLVSRTALHSFSGRILLQSTTPLGCCSPSFFFLSLLSFIRSIFPPFSGRRTLLLLSRRQFHPTESLRSLSRSFGTQQRQQAGSGVRVRVQSQSLFLDLDTYPSHQQGECASRICSSGSQEQQHPTVTARTNGRAARRLVITHNANE